MDREPSEFTLPEPETAHSARLESPTLLSPSTGQATATKVDFRSFWYIACEAKHLKQDRPLAARILDEHLVLFRDETGKAVALRDRCLHRSAPLSRGRVQNGQLVCPYHGWTYDHAGKVTRIPSEGAEGASKVKRCSRPFALVEIHGYIYVNLGDKPEAFAPFAIPHLGERGWAHVRLVNFFRNSVTNCAENFVDIPHTVFVHPGIFRKVRNQRISAQVRRTGGAVHAVYHNETDNLGWFSKFLNRNSQRIEHIDSFYMPNITCVEYAMGPQRHFFITSQSVPLARGETMVYTDLTYDYGVWSWLARPFVRAQAQKIIDQDVEILGQQWQALERSPEPFQNSPADLIHVYIESIQASLERGSDPRQMPAKEAEIEFWV